MIKINFSSGSKVSFPVIVFIFFFSLQIDAQDSFYLQKAIQSCLEQGEVQPYLKPVSFENNEDVLVVQRNSLTPVDLKLYMFGKEAYILDDKELFFLGIKDYVALTDVQTEKDKITIMFTAGAQFTCIYSAKRDKVKKLDKIESK